MVKVVYKSEIPLSLERNEPALADTKKFVETFNNNLNSTEVSRLVWRSVLNQTPDLSRAFKEANLSDEALAVQQTLIKKDGEAPLRLRESSSPRDFVLDVNLPVQGLSLRSGEIFASAIQYAMSDAALSEPEASASSAKPGPSQANGTADTASQAEQTDLFRDQLLKAKQDYLKIEFLLNKLARQMPEYASFMATNDSEHRALQFTLPATGTAIAEAQEYFILQAQFERMQRMVALLLAEGKMKSDEATDTVQRARGLRDQIFQLVPLARREAERSFTNNITRRARGKYVSRVSANADPTSNILVDNVNTVLMPTLVAVSIGATSENRPQMVFEQPAGKRRIALVLGAFLGAFGGFAVGGLRVFVQKNARRLREVAAT